jgi:hypothetical protein
MAPDEDERRAIVANLRGALGGGRNLTKALEEERRLEREREDVEAAQSRAAAKALFALMDSDGFDLDLDAIDRLNGPTADQPTR